MHLWRMPKLVGTVTIAKVHCNAFLKNMTEKSNRLSRPLVLCFSGSDPRYGKGFRRSWEQTVVGDMGIEILQCDLVTPVEGPGV